MKTAKRILAQMLALIMVISTLGNVYATATATESMGDGFAAEESQGAAGAESTPAEVPAEIPVPEATQEETQAVSTIEEVPVESLNTDHPDGGLPGEVPVIESTTDQTGITESADPSVVISEEESAPVIEEVLPAEEELLPEGEVFEEENDTEEVNEIATTLVLNYDAAVGGEVTTTSETIDLTSAYTITGSEAIASDGYLFTGWEYEDGSLVSDKNVYVPGTDMIDYIVYYGIPDENGVITATFTARFEEGVEVSDYVYVGSTLIQVRYNSAAFEEPVMLDAKEITTRDAEYAQVEAAVDEATGADVAPEDVDFAAFDIFFLNGDGAEVEPKEGSFVAVSISTTGSETPEPEEVEQVLHIDGENNVEEIAADTTGTTVDFVTESFSIYVLIGEFQKKMQSATGAAYVYVEGNRLDPNAIRIDGKYYVPASPEKVDVTFEGPAARVDRLDAGNAQNGVINQAKNGEAKATLAGYETYQSVWYKQSNGTVRKVSSFEFGNHGDWNNFDKDGVWVKAKVDGVGEEAYLDSQRRPPLDKSAAYIWIVDDNAEGFYTTAFHYDRVRMEQSTDAGQPLARFTVGAANFGNRKNTTVKFTANPAGTGAFVKLGDDLAYEGVYYRKDNGNVVYNEFVKVNNFFLRNTTPEAWHVEAELETGERVTYYRMNGEDNTDKFVFLHADESFPGLTEYQDDWVQVRIFMRYDRQLPAGGGYANRQDNIHASVSTGKYVGGNNPAWGNSFFNPAVFQINVGKMLEYGAKIFSHQDAGVGPYEQQYYTFVTSGTAGFAGNNDADLPNAADFFHSVIFPNITAEGQQMLLDNFGTLGDGSSNYIGYVLKWEHKDSGAGDNFWHLDGAPYTFPMYMVQMYEGTPNSSNRTAINNGTDWTVSTFAPANWQDPKVKFEKHFRSKWPGADINWTDNFNGIITDANGMMHKFTIEADEDDPEHAGKAGVQADGTVTYEEMMPGMFWLAKFTVQFEDVPTGNIKIEKKLAGDLTDAIRGQNFIFEVKDAAGNLLKFKKDGASYVYSGLREGDDQIIIKGAGTAELKKLPEGSYTVSELGVVAPVGFSVETTPNQGVVDVTVRENRTADAVITNTYTAENTQVKVTKRWYDNENKEGLRPSSVTVKLMNGNTEAGSVILNEENSWTHTFTGLKKLDANGNAINYTVKEVEVPNYTSKTEGNMASGYIITNTRGTETISIPVEKKWDDKGDDAGLRPATVTVKLLWRLNDNAGFVDSKKTVVLSETSGWKGSFDDLPKYANGKPVGYSVEEVKVDNYSTSYDPKINVNVYTTARGEITADNDAAVRKGFVVTNTYKPEYFDIPVWKKWADENNRYLSRPTSVTFRLYRDGVDTNETLTLTENPVNEGGTLWWAKGWFRDLPRIKNGKKVTYTVVEMPISGYHAEVDGDQEKGFAFCNTYSPTFTTLFVEKVWNDEDNAEGFRPESITVELLRDGQPTGDTVTLSEGKWTHTFQDLPKKIANRDVTYSVREKAAVDGYTTEITNNSTGSTYSYRIENTHETTPVQIPVRKEWLDEQGVEGFRPASVTVKLLADGVEVNRVVLSAQNNWSYTFAKDQSGKTLLKYAGKKEIAYSVEEVEVEHYDSKVEKLPDGSFKLTNERTKETVDVDVTKTWEDEENKAGFRPDGGKITVRLYANGVEIDSADLNNSKLTHEWKGLQKYENKAEIVYTLTEDPVDKYTATITSSKDADGNVSFAVTNAYTPLTTHVSVEKEWDDQRDKEGFRKTVKVTLQNDAGLPEQTAELTRENGWYYDFQGLQKHKNGKEINYTITEAQLDGYEIEVTGDMTYGFRLINTHIVDPLDIPVQKVWEDNGNSDGFRPEGVQVRLLGDFNDGKGFIEVASRRLHANSDPAWSYVFRNQQRNANGLPVTYKVQEVSVDRYESKVEINDKSQNPDYEKGFTVTNTYEPETVKVTVTKVWEDEQNKAGFRPANDAVKVTLLADGQEKETVTLDKNNNLTHTWNDLPKYEGGAEILYTVSEEQVARYNEPVYDYTKDMDGNVDVEITNSFGTTPKSVTVTKEWIDDKNKEGFRPASIVVTLENDAELPEETATLNEANNWTATFRNLQAYKNAKEVTYTVSEARVPGYEEPVYVNNGTGNVVIKNERIITPVDIPVEKEWDDEDIYGVENGAGLRPGEVTVNLYKVTEKGEEFVDSLVLKQTTTEAWKGVFRGLQEYEGAEKIVYVVKEEPVEYYDSVVSLNDTEDITKGVKVKNTLIPQNTELAVEKIWEDEGVDLTANPRPTSVTIKLLADNKPAKDAEGNEITVVLDENNNWKHPFKELPKYRNAGNRAVEIVYTVDEEKVPNYNKKIKGEQKITIDGVVYDGFIVTNTRTPDDTPVKEANGDPVETILEGRDQEINYSITTVIPVRDNLDSELDGFQILDKINDALEFKTVHGILGNVKVEVAGVTLDNDELLEDGKTTVVKIDGQQLTVTMPKRFLAERHQGQSQVVVTFTAKIKDEIPDDVLADLLETSESGDLEIPNRAIVRIHPPEDDPTEIPTNIPKVRVPEYEIEKFVDGGDYKKLDTREQEFTYTIKTHVSEKQNLTKFEIVDTLDPAILFAGTDGEGDVTVSIAGADVDVDTVAKKLTVSLAGDVAKKNQGKEITVTFKARLTDDEAFDFTGYEQGEDGPLVPNVANYINYIDGTAEDPVPSEEVNVTPPDPVPDKDIVHAEQHMDELELEGRYDDIGYAFMVRMPYRKNMTSYVLKDELKPVLQVKDGTSVKVLIDGVDVSDRTVEVTPLTDGQPQTITVTFSEATGFGDGTGYVDPMYIGSEIEVFFTAVIRDGADLSEYIVRDHVEIENEVSGILRVPGSDPIEIPSDKPRVIPPDTGITKEVDGETKDHKDLAARDELITYTLKTVIPEKDGVTNFVITDNLEEALEFAGPVSVTVNGTNVTGAASTSGQILTVTVPSRYLTQKQYQGKDVVVKFLAQIRADYTDEQLAANYMVDAEGNAIDHVEIPNDASYRFELDGREYTDTTNIVTVTPPDAEIEKTANGKTDKAELTGRYDDINYEIVTNLPTRDDIESFVITDTLEPVLKFAGANGEGDVAVTIDGAAIDVNKEDGKLTVTFTGDALKNNKGKEVKVSFTAQIKSEEDPGFAQLDFTKYIVEDGMEIPNVAKYHYEFPDGSKTDEVPSNEVVVTPPDPKPDKGIEETQADGSVQVVDEAKLNGRYDDIPYVIEMFVPEREDVLAGYTITDVLKDVLTLKKDANGNFTAITVTVNGEDVTGVQSYDEGTNTVTVNFAEGNKYLAKEYQGKKVVVKFTAVIKDGADLSDYIVEDHVEIENDVSYKLNAPGSEPVWSDIVKVIPDDPEPEKEVDGAPHVTLEGRDQVVTYTIKTVVPERDDIETFEIIDEIEEVMEFTQTASQVKVTINGNVNVTNAVTINGQVLTVNVPQRYLTAQNKGKELIVAFKAKIRDVMPDGSEVDLTPYLTDAEGKVLDNVEIPNEAVVRVVTPGNDPTEKTTPKVTITPPDTEIEKQVVGDEDGDRHYDMQERNEVINYVITSKVPVRGNLKKFVITDELTDVLNHAGTAADVKVESEGKDIKDDVAVEVSGKILTVTFDKAAAEKYMSKNVVVTFGAVVDYTKDLTQHLNEVTNRVEIPNTAKFELTLDNNSTEDDETDPVIVTPPDPELDKEAKGENVEKKVTLTGRDVPIEYTIRTEVPVRKFIDSFVITDELEPVLKLAGTDGKGDIKVMVGTDEKMDDMSGLATAAADGKSFEVRFEKADAEANQGKKVVITFTAMFEEGADLSDYIAESGEPEVPNEAKYVLNTPGNEPVEEVSEKPYVTPGDPGIVKEVEGGTHYDLPEGERDKVFTYTIKTKMPERTNLTKFEVTDKLEEVLEFATGSSGVDVTLDGQKIAGAAKIDQASKTLTVAFDSRYFAQKYLGKDIAITFTAKLGDNVTDEDLVQYLVAERNRVEVPNKASYVLRIGNGPDEDPKDSDEVTVTPPEPELDKETGDGRTYDTHYDMPDLTSDVFYRIKTAVPVHANITSFVVSDTLVDEMEFRSAAQEVEVTIGGTKMNGLASISGQTLTVYLNEQTAVANRGKEMVVVFKAGIKAGADVSQWLSVDTNRVDIPNKAKYVLTLPGDDPVERETKKDITITPGDPDITKEITNLARTNPDRTHLYLENYNGETYRYTLKTQLPMRTNVNQFIIEDILVDEMKFESGVSRGIAFNADRHVSVTVGGRPITGTARTVQGNARGRSVADEQVLEVSIPKNVANANPGAEVVVEFYASLRPYADLTKYTDPATGQINVPNDATYYLAFGGVQSARAGMRIARINETGGQVIARTDEVYVTPLNPETITYTVNKIWNDADDQDGKRPEAITIHLYANGAEVAGVSPAYANANSNWRVTFEGIESRGWYGEEIVYTILEDVVDGYTTSYRTTANGTEVTNDYTPEQTNINVVKTWNDANNAYDTRPTSITVRLLANGRRTGDTLTLNTGNGWTGSFRNLDRFANGALIEYTVEEDTVNRYTAAITRTGSYAFTIENTLTDIPPQTPPNTPPVTPPATPGTPGTPATPARGGTVPVAAPVEPAGAVLGVRRTGDPDEAVLGARRGITGDKSTEKRTLMMVLSSAMALLATLASKKRRKDEA